MTWGCFAWSSPCRQRNITPLWSRCCVQSWVWSLKLCWTLSSVWLTLSQRWDINQWCSASADNPVLLPEGLESHHTKQQLRMMLIMLVQSFLIMSYQVDVIVPRFCFPPSGTGRCVWRVHFLSSSWQPPQLLLRPPGWDATLEFDNEATFFLYIAFSEILITSLIAQTPVKHLQFFKGNVVLAWTFLCVTCVRGWCSPAQESLWLTIPTSEWSLCLIMKRWGLFKFSYLSSLKETL